MKKYNLPIKDRYGISSIIYANILLINVLVACVNKNKDTLYLNEHSSTITDTLMIYKKVSITYGDSTIFQRHFDNSYLESDFIKSKDKVYELRHRVTFAHEKLGYDSILTFSHSDTTFDYISSYRLTMYGTHLFLRHCRYDIRKLENEYMTTKTSLIDSSFKEIFYYNHEYRIHKFIYKYRQDVLIYDLK